VRVGRDLSDYTVHLSLSFIMYLYRIMTLNNCYSAFTGYLINW